MSFKELFENLPNMIKLFVPGFVFLVTCKYFIESENKDFEVTVIGSIVLSYIFNLLAEIISVFLPAPDYIYNIVSIILAFICSIVVVILRLTHLFKNIVIKIGKITGSSSIWYDFFDMNKGTRVRFYCKYDGDEVTVKGDIKYFEECQDSECNFVINNFEIETKTGDLYNSTDENAAMIFNTKNITGLEAHYGK